MKNTFYTYQMRSQALKIAHSLKKQGWDFSQAQKRGWEVVRCQKAMQLDAIVIRFYKTGDDVPQQRIASAVSLSNYTPKGSIRKGNPLQVVYYDHNKGAVRSFNVERFAGFKAVA